MPLRDDDVWPQDGLEKPSSVLSREARENLEQRLMQIAKISRGAFPVKARMTARWILGYAYRVLTDFHYPHPGPRSQFVPTIESMKRWVGKLPNPIAPDRVTMKKIEDSSVRTVLELVLFIDDAGVEHAVVHYHPHLTLEQAAGLLRCFLGFRRSAAA